MNGGIPPKGNGLSPYHSARGGRCVEAHCTYFSSDGPLLQYVCEHLGLMMGFLIVTQMLTISRQSQTHCCTCIHRACSANDVFVKKWWQFRAGLRGEIKKGGAQAIFSHRGPEFPDMQILKHAHSKWFCRQTIPEKE